MGCNNAIFEKFVMSIKTSKILQLEVVYYY